MSNKIIEEAKKKAACQAVDDYVKQGQIVGIGSGSTIVYAVERLAQRVKDENLKVKCIPTSFQARQLILDHGLDLTSLETNPKCSVTIDGCDESDSNLTLIKGGGGCLAQEKVVARFADKFVVIADSRKNSKLLGTSFKYIPVEVLPLAYKPIQLAIEEKLWGKVKLRLAKAKAGPVVTDNSNFLLDWYFADTKEDQAQNQSDSNPNFWKEINDEILNLPGVVDTGLFFNMTKTAYFGSEDGNVKKIEKI